jgi:hypothetical protein
MGEPRSAFPAPSSASTHSQVFASSRTENPTSTGEPSRHPSPVPELHTSMTVVIVTTAAASSGRQRRCTTPSACSSASSRKPATNRASEYQGFWGPSSGAGSSLAATSTSGIANRSQRVRSRRPCQRTNSGRATSEKMNRNPMNHRCAGVKLPS